MTLRSDSWVLISQIDKWGPIREVFKQTSVEKFREKMRRKRPRNQIQTRGAVLLIQISSLLPRNRVKNAKITPTVGGV